MQADALEQLGYQAESGTWRNAYLLGAHELRTGSPDFKAGRGRQLAHAMTAEQLFDSMGVRLSWEVIADLSVNINWTLSDLGETHVMGINNCAIHHLADRHADDAVAAITLTRHTLAEMLGGVVAFADVFTGGDIVVDGDETLVAELFESLTEFRIFPLIEPHDA